MKNLGIQTGTSEASFTNMIQDTDNRISDPEDTIAETDTVIKENVKS